MTAPAAVDGLHVEASDGVLHIVIDRPERKGSLGAVHQERIIQALEQASVDDTLRAVLIRSAGDNFCSGADWVATNAATATPRTGAVQRRLPLHAHRVVALLQEIQLPVACAVQGWAAGLGCQIALASDFVVATETSNFWLPFARRGFTPDSGSTWLLPRLIGVARAKEMLMLGQPVSGRDAADWGMIYRAVPPDALDDSVAELVDTLKSAPTVALGLAKRCVHNGLDGTMLKAMEAEAMALELSSRTSDFREGLAAFKERRDPRFQGH